MRVSLSMKCRAFVHCTSLAALLLAVSTPMASAQGVASAIDSSARVTVRVFRDSIAESSALSDASVRIGKVGALTDARGQARLTVPAGRHTVFVLRIGFLRDSLVLTLRPSSDTTVSIALKEHPGYADPFIITSVRSERRIENVPLRVEVIDEEEIAEKISMVPGDISMMLNETSGLRVQTTNPSLGGANVRIQGLRGRYSLILADGLPLYGGQAGGLGLLQIPPLDLGRVEIIKGTASALYGSSALGGVIDLISRRPGDEREESVLINQTSRGGTDGVAFLAGPASDRWGYTLLAGAHRQTQNDLDADGWTDMPGYARGVVRPRFYFDNGNGTSAFLTGGFTTEKRDGGTVDGRTVPTGSFYREALKTDRADIGALARWPIAGDGALNGSIVSVRGSAMEQRHAHQFGLAAEDDRHRTFFGEASIALPRGAATYVAGFAFQQDAYRNKQVSRFDYTYSIPALFLQTDVDPASWLSLSGSARMDAHSEFGTYVNPRVSALLRSTSDGALSGWTARISSGTGMFAPSPLTEETEATGLTPVIQPFKLRAERARSVSVDVGGPIETGFGEMQLNATAFGTRIANPVQVSEVLFPSIPGNSNLTLLNGSQPTRTWGGELLARITRPLGDEEESPVVRMTTTYTYLRSRECDPQTALLLNCYRREVPLTPRHAASVVTTFEQEGKSRIGLELYYTGRQSLENNPFRQESKPYLIVGLMGDRSITTKAGTARVFLNFENITNVRQTRFDPLRLNTRGAGGRWATDAWTDLAGFTVNGGVRFSF